MLGHPAVLHLRRSVITDNTVNGDCVACNGLNIHCIISYRTVCGVNTVNKNLVTVLVFDVHITIGSICNINDCTGNVILVGSIIILCIKCTKSKCLFNSKNRICCGRNYCSAVAIALVVAVLVDMTESCIAFNSAYGCTTICTLCNNLS